MSKFIFTQILDITCPAELDCEASTGKNPAFEICFHADGEIPFPQVILHSPQARPMLFNEQIQRLGAQNSMWAYRVLVSAACLNAGEITIQVEGCRRPDWQHAGGEDWIKRYTTLRLRPVTKPQIRIPAASLTGHPAKLYFGIHKHMHQPYYNTTDVNAWDGEKDGIFGSRGGNYTDYVPAAVRQYSAGGLANAGLSTSWSGSLIEQLDRCAANGWCGGRFHDWSHALRDFAQDQTQGGARRMAFSAFGFFHPLMPLIPARNIVRQIDWHRDIIREHFGVEPSNVLFPPETAFHVRMIPALLQAGVKAVIYDSIHRYRTCRDYPYAGMNEGMLPPNAADQVNSPVDDWLQLQNIWAGSQISPSLLRPEYVGYEDPDGKVHRIIAIPAERYIGNEDARGGFGALQYPAVLGQVYDQLVATQGFDPKHPPFFLLHSDGDNHGGGADSYYKHNTSQLVQWLQEDPRFELITCEDYLRQFPPDPAHTIHIEPGSWSGADNGDPQFMKWFSRYDQPYSPDLNSWAVLTAFQNAIHSLEDAEPKHPQLPSAIRLMLTAETSCYWYWTGQQVWDQQVTNAANLGHGQIGSALAGLRDRTGPTIFAPWTTPENPGGLKWGNHCLVEAPRECTVHTFVADISGLQRVDLVLRSAQGEKVLPMRDHGPYPSQTGAIVSADYCTVTLPTGLGDVRYFIEAEDKQGNVSRGALERIFLA